MRVTRWMCGLLLGVALVTGCAEEEAAPPPAWREGNAEALFAQDVLHEVRLSFATEGWETLRRHYDLDTYYPVLVEVDGTGQVMAHARSRGSGTRSGTKPGLKLDFNRTRDSNAYFGLKELVLDNLLTDPSFLSERLSFQAFEQMGIAAPRNAFARLYVNGEYWGLYALVESVDKRFLERRFGEKGGNLFDYEAPPGGPYDLSLRGTEVSDYIPSPFEPQSNEDSLDASGLLAFLRTVNEAPDGTFVRDVSAFIDVDAFLAYLAVETATHQVDGMGGVFGTNNFYLYQYAGTQRFVFIPWDKDYAFLGPSWPVFPPEERNVLVRRLLADPSTRERYVSLLKTALRTAVSPQWLRPRAEAAYALIRESVLEDAHRPAPGPVGSEASRQHFEAAYQQVLDTLDGREADVLSRLP